MNWRGGGVYGGEKVCEILIVNVVDQNPDTDPDPAFQVNPDLNRIQGFDDQIEEKKIQLNSLHF